jgi:hypothetical protein
MASLPNTSFCLLQFSHQNAPYNRAPAAFKDLRWVKQSVSLECTSAMYIAMYGQTVTSFGKTVHL